MAQDAFPHLRVGKNEEALFGESAHHRLGHLLRLDHVTTPEGTGDHTVGLGHHSGHHWGPNHKGAEDNLQSAPSLSPRPAPDSRLHVDDG